jgi:hypothetical protein
MAKTRDRPRPNNTLQSGPGGDVAYGQDARMFGEGGQTIERAFEPGQDNKPHRDPATKAFRKASIHQGASDDREPAA